MSVTPLSSTPSSVRLSFDPETGDELDALLAELAALPPNGGRIVALLPAHNEQASVEIALDSLAGQTRRPDVVVVVTDNCTDDTAGIVRRRGDSIVVASQNNAAKKAGALNQVLARLLPVLDEQDAVLVMDADSSLDPRFLEAARNRLGTPAGAGRHSRRIGGVGGTFRGGRGGGFVGMLQRNEYARYARDVHRRKGRVLVLTGTAALFQVAVLRQVVSGRASGALPGGAGHVYDTNVLTEDNELTIALLHLGYAILSPQECLLETEVMTTWRDLWNQRVRWKRGAFENLTDYGWTDITRAYWGRQLMSHIGVAVTAVYLATVAWSLGSSGTLHLHPIWTAVTLVFLAERVVTVRTRGPVQMLLASVLVVEMTFDFFLQAAQARALWLTITHAERAW